MTRPTSEEEIIDHGIRCTVLEFVEPTDVPWDGEFPLEPGSEGWDVTYEVTAHLGSHEFKSGASVGGHWVCPDQEGFRYLDEQKKEVRDEALANVLDEIRRVGKGEYLIKEAVRTSVARTLCENGLGYSP